MNSPHPARGVTLSCRVITLSVERSRVATDSKRPHESSVRYRVLPGRSNGGSHESCPDQRVREAVGPRRHPDPRHSARGSARAGSSLRHVPIGRPACGRVLPEVRRDSDSHHPRPRDHRGCAQAWIARPPVARAPRGRSRGGRTRLALAAQGKIRHAIKTISLEQVNEHLELLRAGEIVGRAVVTYPPTISA